MVASVMELEATAVLDQFAAAEVTPLALRARAQALGASPILFSHT